MHKSYIIAFTVLIVASLWMLPAFLSNKSNNKIIDKSIQTTKNKPITKVGILQLSPKPMSDRVEVNGQTKASRIIEIRSRTAGRFSDVFLERGTVINKGQLIAQMDIDDRKSMLDRAEAVLRQRTTEYDVSKGLESKGFNSKVKFETVRANLAIAKTDLKQAKLDLSYTKIKAPFSGVLEERHVEIGTYVREGDAIATVVDLDPMDISAFVSERYISFLDEGMEAEVKFANDETVKGKINYIATVANTDTRTFRVDVRIDNKDNKIPSGLTAQISFLLPEHKAHEIPLSSLVLSDKGIVGVKVAEKLENTDNESWVARFIPVSLLREDTKTVWVDGLNGNIDLITTGHEFIVDDQNITPIEQAGSQ